MFDQLLIPIDKWISASAENGNIYVAVVLGIILVSLAVMVFFQRKMGKSDERTESIWLRIGLIAFMVNAFANSLYITQTVEKVENVVALSAVPVVMMTIAAAIASVVYYLRSK